MMSGISVRLRDAARFVFEIVSVAAALSDLLRQHVEQRARRIELVRDRVREHGAIQPIDEISVSEEFLADAVVDEDFVIAAGKGEVQSKI